LPVITIDFPKRSLNIAAHPITHLAIFHTSRRFPLLNPVRAAMVDDPARFRWTSCRVNAQSAADSRITPPALYRQLGSSDQGRQIAYRVLFCAQLERGSPSTIFDWH
jgi:hypothetical protein